MAAVRPNVECQPRNYLEEKEEEEGGGGGGGGGEEEASQNIKSHGGIHREFTGGNLRCRRPN